MARAETTGERIKTMRMSRGITQAQFADVLKCSQSTVAAWENDTRIPRGKAIEAMADIFNVPPYAIRYGEHEVMAKPKNVREIGELHHHKVPLVGTVAAGEPIYDEEVDLYVDGPNKADCAVRVRGDSMEPVYLDGDIVFIRTQPDVMDGQIHG